MATDDLKKNERRVLDLYRSLGKDSLDLHALFEAGGNDPAAREAVLDAVTTLVNRGYLEASGSDYYALTEAGRDLIR